MATVEITALRRALGRRALGLGFSDTDAELLADHFCDAELRGLTGHGAERLRWLARRGSLDPRAQPRLESRADGAARYRSHGAIGYVALARAMDAELDDPPTGARLVTVSDCFPTGRLGYFAARAADRGLVCLVTATSTARIVHPDGGRPVLGTNPFCLGVPAEPAPMVVDVSMGRTTYGAVLKARADGRPLPAAAAVRIDGAATVDPGEVVDGAAGILPFGGDQAYKGFALALIVELLCDATCGMDGHGAVALLAAPAAFPVARLRERADGVRLPGAAGDARRAAAEARGTVEIADSLWEWLET